MQLNVFISDIYLECVPKFHVTAMRLIVHLHGNEFNLLGIWSSNLKIIRFQEIIHANVPDVGSAFISFELIAVLSNDAESRIIGSGDLSLAVTHNSVNQTVMLSSSTMDTLMAQLQLTISFDKIVLSDKDSMVKEQSDLLNQHPYSYPHSKISNVSQSNKLSKSPDFFSNDASKRSNTIALKSSIKTDKRTSNSGAISGYKSYFTHVIPQQEVSETQTDLEFTDATSARYERDEILNKITDQTLDLGLKRKSSSGMRTNSSVNSTLIDAKGVNGVIRNHSRSSSQNKSPLFVKHVQKAIKEQVRDKKNFKVSHRKVASAVKKPIGSTSEIRIHPEVMKQNEACDRLKAALKKKEEMLEKAQSQLNSSMQDNERRKTHSQSPSKFRYEESEMTGRSNKREESFRLEESEDFRRSLQLRNRLKLAEERRLNILKNTKNRAIYTSSVSTNKSVQIRDNARRSIEIEEKLRNKFDQKEENLKIMEMKIDSQLRNSVCAVRNVDKRQSTPQAIRENILLMDLEEDRQHAVDLKARLRSAEERRMRLLRDTKGRAAILSAEADHKAQVIREAVSSASKKYDELRDDYDRKDEMLRRIQDEIDIKRNKERAYVTHPTQMNSSMNLSINLSLESKSQRLEKSERINRNDVSTDSFGLDSDSALNRSTNGCQILNEVSSANKSPGRGRKPSRTGGARRTSTGEKSVIPFSNLQRRSYSVSSPSSSQRKSNQFQRSDSKSHTQSSTHFSDVHNSPYHSHDNKQKRSHSTNSYRQTRGNTDTTQFPEPYVHYIPSTTSIKNNKKTKSNSNNGQHSNSPAPPRASTPVKLSSSELNISKTQNRLMALVLDRIEKLKQRITEVSPAEGENMLRMIRKLIPLTLALSPSKMKKKRTSPSKSNDLRCPDVHTSYPGPANYGYGSNQNADYDMDFEKEDGTGSIDTDVLVSQLGDILGITAEYGSPKQSLGRRQQAKEDMRMAAQPYGSGTIIGSTSTPSHVSSDSDAHYSRSGNHSLGSKVGPTGSEGPSADRSPFREKAVMGNGYYSQHLNVNKGNISADMKQDTKNVMNTMTESTDRSMNDNTNHISNNSIRSESSSVLSSLQHMQNGSSILACDGDSIVDSLYDSIAPLTTSILAGGVVKAECPDGTEIISRYGYDPSDTGYGYPSPSGTNSVPPIWPLMVKQSNQGDGLSNDMSRDGSVDISRNDNLNESLLRHLNHDNDSINFNEYTKQNNSNVSTKASDRMYTDSTYHKNLDNPPLPSFSSTIPLPSPPPYMPRTIGTYMTDQKEIIETKRNNGDDINDIRGSVLNETSLSANNTFITANDSFMNTNDTSINITRQIDDVGKAISTLQKRIASYMYISPDNSPNLNHRAMDTFSASPSKGMDCDEPLFGTPVVDDVRLSKCSLSSTDVGGTEENLNIVARNGMENFGSGRSGNNSNPLSPRPTFENIYPPDPGDFVGSGSYSQGRFGYMGQFSSEQIQRALDPSLSQRHPIFTAPICREDTDSDTDMDYDPAKTYSMDDSSVSTISTYNGSNLISTYDPDVKIKHVNDYKMSYNTNFEQNDYNNDDKKESKDVNINQNNGLPTPEDLLDEDLSIDIYKKSVLDNYLKNERIQSAFYNARISVDKLVVDENGLSNSNVNGFSSSGVSANGLKGSAYIIDGTQASKPSADSSKGSGIMSDQNKLPNSDDDALKQIFGSDSDDDYDDCNHTDKRVHESTDNYYENKLKNYHNQPTNGSNRLLNVDYDSYGSSVRSKEETHGDLNHLDNNGHKNDKFTIDFNDDFNDIFGSSGSVSTSNSLSHSPSPEFMK